MSKITVKKGSPMNNKVNSPKDRSVNFVKGFFNSSLKLKIIVPIFIIGFVLLIRFFINKAQNGKVTYETSVAEKGTLITSISGTGFVTTSNIQEVTTQASGIVKEMFVEDGQYVVKGEKIAELELDLVGSQRYASAYSSYLNAQKSLNSANNNYRLSQASLAVVYDEIKGHENDETLVMKEKRTKAEVSNDNAYDGTVSAKAQLASAFLSYNQSSPVIRSPANGIVKFSVAQGSQISAGLSSDASNTRVGVVMTEGLPIVSVSVSEIDVTNVKTGQKTTVTLDSIEDKTFTGKVVAVDNLGSSSSGVVNYTVIIILDNKSERILPNMAVSTEIITNIKTDVILIPTLAIQTVDGQPTVETIKDGKVSSVVVEIGSTNDLQTEIVSGVNEGDVVITSTITSESFTQSGGTTSPFSGIGRSGNSGSSRGSGERVFIGGPGF